MMNFIVIFSVLAVMIALRFTRINALGWMAAWWVAIYLVLGYGIEPPLPSSIIFMFMFIVTLALLVYLSAKSEDLEATTRAIVAFLVSPKYARLLAIVVIAMPLLVAAKVYLDASKPIQAPASTRTIHPQPPREIQFKGKTINLITADNPYRHYETSNPDSFKMHVQNGRQVYFQNCVYCHGDDMKGKGLFAHGFDPIPANFADPTTIAMLQESYLFWRIAKGGPGLPDEATPWFSAMPAWEKFLTEEEIWDVILFMYEYTNQVPREREEVH